jgi:UDP:flavonoid glycosyltransferase YjiC (YdhE family)
MKILVAALNWGLGHATRCIPLIHKYMAEGNEVVLGGDGDSLLLLRRHFPALRVLELPSLELRYDEDSAQRRFYWRAIPVLLRFALADYYCLRQILVREHFDLLISDNRFGFFSRDVRSVYITHQLYPILPKRLRIFQPIARAIHACVFRRYHEVWVPDFREEQKCLSGELSHGGRYDRRVKYIGPLSRFSQSVSEGILKECRRDMEYEVVVLLSGLEPQRTLFEREILERFADSSEKVLLVRGKIGEPRIEVKRNNITIVPSLSDEEWIAAVKSAEKVIARSGYSTIMDLYVLEALCKAELHPTPGQSEQEYLSSIW